jgi:hypothetical protein
MRVGLRRKRVASVEIVRWVGVAVAEDVEGGKGVRELGEGGRAIKSSSVVVLVLDAEAWSFDLGVAFFGVGCIMGGCDFAFSCVSLRSFNRARYVYPVSITPNITQKKTSGGKKPVSSHPRDSHLSQ